MAKATTKSKAKKSTKKTTKKTTKKIIKTVPTPKTYNVTNIVAEQDEQQELLNAYLSMAGTEIFQVVNNRTIDGIFNDVSIISILASRRADYSPQDMIEVSQPKIINIEVVGTDLVITTTKDSGANQLLVEFYTNDGPYTITSIEGV